jgi:hypothetical protein
MSSPHASTKETNPHRTKSRQKPFVSKAADENWGEEGKERKEGKGAK